MGKIVSAAALSHTFGLRDQQPEAADRIAQGMLEIGRRLRATKPDILIVVSSDHLTNFNLDFQIPYAIGVADEYTPLGDLGTTRTSYRGHREFATGLNHFASEQGFDLVAAENLTPDHGISLPNEFINEGAQMALVPMYINTVVQPTPTCARSHALGRIIAEFVRSRPEAERVAIVATGGLSHWICLPDSGRVNAEWDNEIMSLVESGRGHELSDWTPARIREDGGNGGLEIATWACMAGATGDARGDRIFYEPMHSWWTGMGGIVMNISPESLEL